VKLISHTMCVEHRLRVFENRVLRGILARSCRRLHHEKLRFTTYEADQIKEDEMGGIRSTHGRV
jgi:hypothetical protein